MGYWQNKNGQGIINGANQANLGNWLRQFHPFSDAPSSALGTYVTNIIKAANASGTAMNPMLKAQMLATALDVYFSDPALGGNKIKAPAPIGSVSIDLTKVNAPVGSGTYEDDSAAFSSGCETISAALTDAAGHSNPGGSVWYAQVKATQQLAKDAFDAVNNTVVFGSAAASRVVAASPDSRVTGGRPRRAPSACGAHVAAELPRGDADPSAEDFSHLER